jgi:hypothetical protein
MENTIQEARPTEVTVRASINERKFFDSMKHLFASSYSVLGELMQNARRAGATRIDFTVDVEKKTASVVDDGYGITDFGVLVALCDSGWSEQVQLTDKPFGMGLFSLFFAAESVSFRSGGQSLTVSLDDIVKKLDLLVQNDPETAGIPGTRIELRGLSDKLTELSCYHPLGGNLTHVPTMFQEIERRAEGFPIQVFINGQECDRAYAQAALHGTQTPIGFVSYPGVTDDSTHIPKVNSSQWFLQGLPIGSLARCRQPIAIHLDSVQFTARMPDRSDLFDRSEQEAKISAVLEEMVKNRLAQLKASMDPKEFTLKHWNNCKDHHCLHLMDDVPWIPANRFCSVDRVSMNGEEVYCPCSFSNDLVSREQLLSGEVFVVRGTPYSTSDSLFAALKLKVMQHMDMLTLMDNLGEGHWSNALAPVIDDLKFDWEVTGEKAGVCMYWSDSGKCDIRLADEVTVNITSKVDESFHKEVVFKDDWLLLPYDPIVDDEDYSGEWDFKGYVIGNDMSPDEPVDAMSTFCDAEGNFRDEWRDTALTEFRAFVQALQGKTLSYMVASVLRKHMTGLSEKQLPHLAVVRAVQYRNQVGELKSPIPDVIDITDEAFWMKVAGAMSTTGTEEEIATQAAVIRHAFTTVVQPGWQEPAESNGQ